MDIICFSIPILGLIISFLLWFRFGKDDMVVDTVEFYPPDGINSLEQNIDAQSPSSSGRG